MNIKAIKSGMVLLTLATSVLAQDDSPWGRISVSYRAAFNISADFTGLGGFAPTASPGGPGRIAGAPGTVARTYDDGFIGIDVSGNANGRTTYWGYNNGPDVAGSQVVGDTVQMHSSSSPATAYSSGVDDDPQHGLELSYLHRIGGGERWRWGVEGALNWTDIGIRDNRTLAGNAVTLTHAFALDGALPPVTPPAYAGPVDDIGPQLSDNAVDVSGAPQLGAATISGYRKIEADLFGLRLGPYWEFDLCRRASVTLSGGFSAGFIDSEFEYNDLVTISGLGTRNPMGRDHSTDWLYGGYVRGQINVHLCKSASFIGGAEFNSLSSFDQSAGTARVRLDLGSAFYVTGGFSFNF